MKAWLVLQEGPAAGRTYPLDPSTKPVYSIGRSSECDVVLNDTRASRHHADIRWDGQQWTVVDQNSTNGTYVNGLRVHRPYDLHLSDRVTIGETTMVLRQASPDRAVAGAPGQRGQDQPRPRRASEQGGTDGMEAYRPAVQPIQQQRVVPPRQAAGRPPAMQAAATGPPSTGLSVGFWIVQGAVAAAVVLLASGALLPWIRVTGSLSEEIDPLIRTLTDIASLFLKTESGFEFTQEIHGLQGYGKLTLGIAAVSLVVMLVDMFFHRDSFVPGVVYLLSGLVATGAMAFDMANFYRLFEQAGSLSLLFGIRLEQVIDVFDYFVDVQIALLPGLILTLVGLLLLLVAGIGRLLLALLVRKGSR